MLSCLYLGLNIVVIGVFWGCKFVVICFLDDGDIMFDCFIVLELEGIVKGRCEGKELCELEVRYVLL